MKEIPIRLGRWSSSFHRQIECEEIEMFSRRNATAILIAWFALVVFGPATAGAQMFVAVDGYVIFDGGAGDLQALPNVILFNSLAAPPDGFTTNSGFDAKGLVQLINGAGAVGGQLNTGQVLVLTDFVADRPTSAAAGPFNIIFENDFGLISPGGGTAADLVVEMTELSWSNDGEQNPPLPG
jgi:hypothetical protein